MATGRRTFTSLNNGKAVSSVAFSRDGTTLAAGADGQISLWDVATGFRTPATPNEDGPVYGVAFSKDGHTLAAGGDDSVQLWDVRTGHLIATLKEVGQVSSVVYSHDGRMLAAGDDNGDITIWDVATRTRIAKLTNDNPISSVAFSPDDRTLAIGDTGGFVGLWDVASHQQLASIGEDDGGADVVISPNGQMHRRGRLERQHQLASAEHHGTNPALLHQAYLRQGQAQPDAESVDEVRAWPAVPANLLTLCRPGTDWPSVPTPGRTQIFLPVKERVFLDDQGSTRLARLSRR